MVFLRRPGGTWISQNLQKNILEAVIVKIAPGGGIAITDRGQRGVGHFGEHAVAIVPIEGVLSPDVRLKQIHVTIAVIIDPIAAPGGTGIRHNRPSGRVSDSRKRPIAIVVEEPTLTLTLYPANANVKVQIAIVIVIAPGRAARIAGGGNGSNGQDFFKGAGPLVMIQTARFAVLPGGNVGIRQSVIIIIGPGTIPFRIDS